MTESPLSVVDSRPNPTPSLTRFPPRLIVVEQVIHLSETGSATEAGIGRFERILKTTEQVYKRVERQGTEPRLLDLGWLQDELDNPPSQVLIESCKSTGGTLSLSMERDGPAFTLLFPGESARFRPNGPIWIKADKEKVKINYVVVPG